MGRNELRLEGTKTANGNCGKQINSVRKNYVQRYGRAVQLKANRVE
ncbi:MAG: hypothetical protein ACI90V_012004 [Bacillariaceae sp.]|jgi:hypothetical protein